MRVVSLVPSLTESLAGSGWLVGATDWCSHPAGLEVARVRGTKNPDLERIIGLRPDLVVANKEENRREDVEALRGAGVEVLVTEITTVDEAFAELRRLFRDGLGLAPPGWLAEAEAAWDLPPPDRTLTAVVPIWRRPWMVVGSGTFTGDVLARLGVRNLYADHPDRYPKVGIEALNRTEPDLVVLPDEPYRFTELDGPEAFPGIRWCLVGGRHLTWYGPSMVEAPARLRAELFG
ncbi:helical backbone metal receptor [Actinocorallia longicatena]|uniref:Helical backbone metal receptor n=1 Tax=Actinocorallia longicatena TaxID=111803 RepID=A0ABP6Q1K1_9ACTN